MKPLCAALLLCAFSWSVQDAKKPPELPPLDDVKKPQDDKQKGQGTKKDGQTAPRPHVDPAAAAESVVKLPPNPFLGVWSVLRTSSPGRPTSRGSGFLIFTRGYLSMHLYATGPAAGARPRFQSSMRRYRVEGPHLVSTSVMGVRNSPRNGEILIEGGGVTERRRFQFFGPNVLRVYQAVNSYIELEKVETLE